MGERLGRIGRPGLVIALRGGLGAGKTTLTRGIARALGIGESVTSPTYTIISEYAGSLNLYHMDAYRLRNEADGEAIGMEEYFQGDGVCVVEWSERIEDLLPSGAVRVDMEILEDGRRRISVSGPDLEELLG